jgi:tRNA-specific adenosine deaminase 3
MFKEYLPCEYTRTLQLTDIYTLEILDPQNTQKTLRLVNHKFPTDLPHLRRIHKNEIYLTQVRNFPDICDLPVSAEYMPHVRIKQVPLHAPVTRMQAQTFGEKWPVVYKQCGLQPTEKIDREKFSVLAHAVDVDVAIMISPEGLDRVTVRVEGGCVRGSLSHPIMKAIDEVARLYKNDVEKYLCTDFSVYVEMEPCVMCCMALLHSRVAEIFFRQERKDELMPGISKHGIHWHPRLNHKYRAYKLAVDVDKDALAHNVGEMV